MQERDLRAIYGLEAYIFHFVDGIASFDLSSKLNMFSFIN